MRAHYPLIDLKRLEAGYPKEVDSDKAEELRMAQLDLSSKIIGDINLCGGGTAPVQGTSLTRNAISCEPTDEACGLDQPSIGRAIPFSSISTRVPEIRVGYRKRRAVSATRPDQPM